MKPKIGNVIEKDTGLFVITQVTNGVVSETEKLEDYIIKHAMVEVDGEWVTIHHVIQERCDLYLESGITISKEVDYCPKCNNRTHINHTMGSKPYIVCNNYGYGCDYTKRT